MRNFVFPVDEQDTTLEGDSDTQPESMQSDAESCHDNKDETDNPANQNQDTNSQASTIENNPIENSPSKDESEENKKEGKEFEKSNCL